jgi:hypothetical protein
MASATLDNMLRTRIGNGWNGERSDVIAVVALL